MRVDDFGFDGACVGFMGGEFFAERSDFGFGGGAGFAFAFDDFYGAEDFLFERLKLVDANGWMDVSSEYRRRAWILPEDRRVEAGGFFGYGGESVW